MRLILLLLSLLPVLCRGLVADILTELGPLYHEYSLTLEPGHRREVLGPLFSFGERDAESGFTLAPLFSYRADSLTDYAEIDFAYPLLTYDRFGDEYRVQLLQIISVAGGQNQQDEQKNRFTLFPFFFYQRSPHPDSNYFAFVPLYGRLKNRLLRDEIFFAAFPLYSQTRKRDVVTDNYIYPFFHLRRGNELRGWQFWPLVGLEKRAPVTRTNQFDEIEIAAGHEKLFVLWPLFFNTKLDIGGPNPQSNLALLPLFSSSRSPNRDSTTYLWPLGFTVTEDREKKYREWGAPWPFIVFARGEGKTANRVWPFYGQARNPALQSDFILWPVYKYNRIQAEPLDRERTRILLFLYSDLIERNTTFGTALHRVDFWPLFTYRRDHRGDQRLQLLAPLEPILPNNKSIERNYSPLWSIWRSESSARTGASSQSLLWNLYRSEAATDFKKCSLLFGLFQYQSTPDRTQWRVLYIPFESRPVR